MVLERVTVEPSNAVVSERGIAWRVADSLTLRQFLSIRLDESTLDHVTISRTRRLIDAETHGARRANEQSTESSALHGAGRWSAKRKTFDWLVRKPGAFENYRYRSDLFPSSWFRLAYDALREEQGPKRGAQEYLAILLLAARRGEDRVEGAVRFLLGSGSTKKQRAWRNEKR
ncbi:MAG: transposase [Bryobacteraceae bacterium]